MVAARGALRVVPGGPRRDVTINGTLDVTPHLRQGRFRMTVASTAFQINNSNSFRNVAFN